MPFKYEIIKDPICLKVIENQGVKKYALVTPDHAAQSPLKDVSPPSACVLTPWYKKIEAEIKYFEVRPDDTWIISFPKSGTTWCQEMIWLLLNNMDFATAQNIPLTTRYKFLEFGALQTETEHLQKLKAMKSPRFIKTHLPLAFLPDQIWTVKPRLIYIHRNPKDVAVSFFYQSATQFQYLGSLHDFVVSFLSDLAIYSPYHSHVLEYNSLDATNVLLLRYEDMKKYLPKVIRNAMIFLKKSYSDEQITQLSQHLSFDSMKKNSAVNNEEWIAQCLEKSNNNNIDMDNIQFIRKGKVGGWKNDLTPELSKRIDEWTRKKVPDNLRKLFDE